MGLGLSTKENMLVTAPDCYNSLYSKVLYCLEKQKVYVEIVDASVYNIGWVTKIEEIEE